VPEIFISQPGAIAIRHPRAKAPVGTIGEFQDSPLLTRTSANDNRLAWPYIPFPENLLV
jgi:hypothetical protein